MNTPVPPAGRRRLDLTLPCVAEALVVLPARLGHDGGHPGRGRHARPGCLFQGGFGLAHQGAGCLLHRAPLVRFRLPVAPGDQFEGIAPIMLAIGVPAASAEVHPPQAVFGDGRAWCAFFHRGRKCHAVLLKWEQLRQGMPFVVERGQLPRGELEPERAAVLLVPAAIHLSKGAPVVWILQAPCLRNSGSTARGDGPDRLCVWCQLCRIYFLGCRIDEQREDHGEHTSFPWNALDIDAPGVTLHQFPSDVQSHP